MQLNGHATTLPILKEKHLPRRIRQNLNKDGIDRRGLLRCVACAGAGVIWTLTGGRLSSAAVRLQTIANATQVKIDNFSFVPKSLTVNVGATVTWTNRDDIPHVVVSTQKKFSSPVLDTDQAFSFTFKQPGSYPYFCKIHPTMTGTIIVVEKSASKAA